MIEAVAIYAGTDFLQPRLKNNSEDKNIIIKNGGLIAILTAKFRKTLLRPDQSSGRYINFKYSLSGAKIEAAYPYKIPLYHTSRINPAFEPVELRLDGYTNFKP
jgi:hypothetical protein